MLAGGVQKNFVPMWQSAPDNEVGFGLELFRDERTPRDVLLVDRFGEGRKLPSRGGVGHARKIGADLAASLIQRECIDSPWIHCTDGDVRLPETYFTCSNKLKNQERKYSALVYPFYHGRVTGNAEPGEIILATQLYEFSLRYYVAGMRFARSPYAFHTIGSTLAVHASHYVGVRGFPRRSAGEDFYLLNKLAKVACVLELETGSDCKPLEIASRLSDRVPFGTGAAVNKITASSNPLKDFRFYNPDVFVLLKRWLCSWPRIWQMQSSDFAASVRHHSSDPKSCTPQGDYLLAGLDAMGTEKALQHAFRQSRDFEQFSRQMHTWFDAFRTLKLIHFLRDHHLRSISIAELEADRVFYQIRQQDADLPTFHDQLRF